MVVKLTEIYKNNKYSEDGRLVDSYSLREIFVNPEHVVCLREDETYNRFLSEGRLGALDKRQIITRVYLNRGQSGIDLVVVGEPTAIQEKLGLGSNKQLLRG
mgnify:CR=1 FL=1|tara:strand:+ start:3345 stop:3650 length:306 start_codon:yes stop_codon:yes gene_type:complete